MLLIGSRTGRDCKTNRLKLLLKLLLSFAVQSCFAVGD